MKHNKIDETVNCFDLLHENLKEAIQTAGFKIPTEI
jgi:hypothetical protein